VRQRERKKKKLVRLHGTLAQLESTNETKKTRVGGRMRKVIERLLKCVYTQRRRPILLFTTSDLVCACAWFMSVHCTESFSQVIYERGVRGGEVT